MREELERGKRHIRFCVELYKMQVKEKRHFVHEHPSRSKAWYMPELMKLKEMIEITMEPAVGMVDLDVCSFGIGSRDEKGEGLVRKTTRILSTSEEAPKILNRRCSNGNAKDDRAKLKQNKGVRGAEDKKQEREGRTKHSNKRRAMEHGKESRAPRHSSTAMRAERCTAAQQWEKKQC